MKLVDVNSPYITVHAPVYDLIEQPMVVYHSTEEFLANESDKPYKIVASGQELRNFILDVMKTETLEQIKNVKLYNVEHYNVWAKTPDTHVPDTADNGGNPTYAVDANGELIPTDGCYLRIYYVYHTGMKYIMYTSGGLHISSFGRWQMTAGVKPNFSKGVDSYYGKKRVDIVDIRLKRLLSGKKVSYNLQKVTSAFLNPLSSGFLDLHAALKTVIKKHRIEDEQVINVAGSEKFKEALMEALKTLFPELKMAVREAFTPNQMAMLINTMWDTAKEQKDVDKMMKVFNRITEVGYEEHAVIKDERPNTKMLSVSTVPTPTANFIEPPKSTNKMEVEDNEKEFDSILAERKEELDYPSSYVNE